jgi:hypothetical protein
MPVIAIALSTNMSDHTNVTESPGTAIAAAVTATPSPDAAAAESTPDAGVAPKPANIQASSLELGPKPIENSHVVQGAAPNLTTPVAAAQANAPKAKARPAQGSAARPAAKANSNSAKAQPKSGFKAESESKQKQNQKPKAGNPGERRLTAGDRKAAAAAARRTAGVRGGGRGAGPAFGPRIIGQGGRSMPGIPPGYRQPIKGADRQPIKGAHNGDNDHDDDDGDEGTMTLNDWERVIGAHSVYGRALPEDVGPAGLLHDRTFAEMARLGFVVCDHQLGDAVAYTGPPPSAIAISAAPTAAAVGAPLADTAASPAADSAGQPTPYASSTAPTPTATAPALAAATSAATVTAAGTDAGLAAVAPVKAGPAAKSAGPSASASASASAVAATNHWPPAPAGPFGAVAFAPGRRFAVDARLMAVAIEGVAAARRRARAAARAQARAARGGKHESGESESGEDCSCDSTCSGHHSANSGSDRDGDRPNSRSRSPDSRPKRVGDGPGGGGGGGGSGSGSGSDSESGSGSGSGSESDGAAPRLSGSCRFSAAVEREYERLGGEFGAPQPTPHVSKERAFVDGVMHRSSAAVFIDVFNHTNMVAFYSGASIPVSYEHADNIDRVNAYLLRGWVPASTFLHVGDVEDEPTATDLLVEGQSSMRPFSADREGQRGRGRQSRVEIDDDSLVVVHCFDPVWGRAADGPGGLHRNLLGALHTVRAALVRQAPRRPNPGPEPPAAPRQHPRRLAGLTPTTATTQADRSAVTTTKPAVAAPAAPQANVAAPTQLAVPDALNANGVVSTQFTAPAAPNANSVAPTAVHTTDAVLDGRAALESPCSASCSAAGAPSKPPSPRSTATKDAVAPGVIVGIENRS